MSATEDAPVAAPTAAGAQERPALRKVLAPMHIWALGVGIVLVGEFMGWNFAVEKGGMYGALVACWVVGLLYTCIVMINSEVTSAIPAAGGQYAQAKHTVGPLMAFNVGLYLTLAYTMLEAANANVLCYLLTTMSRLLGSEQELSPYPFAVLAILALAFLNYRGVFASLTLNFVITGFAFPTILVLFVGLRAWSPSRRARPGRPRGDADERPAVRLDRRDRGLPVRHVVLPRHRGDRAGRGGVPVGAALGAAGQPRRDHDADHRGVADLVRLRGHAALALPGHGDHAAVRRRAVSGQDVLVVLLMLGTLCATLASANGCINDASRAWFSMGRDRYLPEWFGAVHPRYHTPFRAIVFLVPVAIAFAILPVLLDEPTLLSTVITFSILSGLLMYSFMGPSFIRFRQLWPIGSITRAYTLPLHPAPAIALLALSAVVFFATFLGYGAALISILAFYLLASIWFVLRRYKFVRRGAQFTADLPRPEGY